jgi:leukotriene A-4 hydrolase/aminopeptidase
MRINGQLFLNILAIVALLYLGCQQGSDNEGEESDEEEKSVSFEPVHSFARPAEAVVKHLNLDIEVNFDEQTVVGTAQYKIENRQEVDTLILDTRDLNVEKVTTGKENASSTEYKVGKKRKYLGKPLKILIDPETKWVTIHYSTNPGAAALQWLSAGQTADEEAPYLFTQSQAILARTWIPCQDAPGVRYTYDASVQVPEGLLALMSAANPTEKSKDGHYQFSMEQPIPSYLMALAVGEIAFDSLSQRTGVYAEPSVLNDAAYELAKMEEMMKATEKLYGPYEWEQYDVIILPPSFPFGGMENPRLSFATPTILAGDRSLTNLIAHELAHSWSGNLVTNATWNELWLNEGFTVYLERRIMEELYGKSYANMLEVLGFRYLKDKVKELKQSKPEDTRLKMDLEGRDPDEGLTAIPYEKGALFLKTIEDKVGRKRFDQFLKGYFHKFAFTSMTTEHFLQYLRKNLIKSDTALADKIKAEQWIYEAGIPDNHPRIHSKRFDTVEMVVQKWENGTAPDKLDTKGWSTHEWLYFLSELPDSIAIDRMKALDDAFQFTESTNYEILADWLEMGIKNDYKAIEQRLEESLINVGRRKFLKPLYKAMAQIPEGLQKARSIYEKARSNYHSVSRNTIDEILNWDETS